MSFDEFVRSSFERLAIYARLLTGSRQDAEDLLADVFVAVQCRWTQIGDMDHPLAYVRRMVLTRHLNEQRRWFRRQVDLHTPETLPDVEMPDVSHAIVDGLMLMARLAKLPDRQRAAIVLRYYLDLPYDEVAEQLGVTAGGARTLVFRGLDRLRSPDKAAADTAAADTATIDTTIGPAP